MIGESIARMALRRWKRRQDRALREARFDGICPDCGNQMQFLKREERHAEGGAINAGLLFECHGCGKRLWQHAWEWREDHYDIAH